MIDFQANDRGARGYLVLPNGQTGPGVLVLHAWWGLNDAFVGACDRLAAEGYVAFAPDLYDGSTASTIEDAERLMSSSDADRMRSILSSGLDYLLSHTATQPGPSGAIGFSLGAAWAIRASIERPDDLAAVVIFYGAAGGVFEQARAAYQGHFGDRDEWEPLEGVRQMEQAMLAAGRDADIHLYPGASHWFFEPNRPDAYDPEAAGLAWQRTLDFLRRNLRGA